MILATAMPPNPGIASGLAVLAFCLLLADVWWQQRHRRRVWINVPAQLLTQPAGAGLGATASIGAALLAAALSAASYGSAGAPFAAWLTSLTLLGAGHLLVNPLVGAAGLLLAGYGVAAALPGWFGLSSTAIAIGLSLAGLWMIWLARFWRQQLLDGAAWTTAGRLIPAARALAAAACVALAGAFAARLPAQHTPDSMSGIGAAFVLVLVLLLFRLQSREAGENGAPIATTGAWLAAWSAGWPLADLLQAMRLPLEPALAACVVPVGYLAASPIPGRFPSIRLFICVGWIPVIGFLAILTRPWTAESTSTVLTFGLIIVAAMKAPRGSDVRQVE